MAGLEPVLVRELEALGAESVTPLSRAAACRGDLRLLYRANLELRTALRVLVPIARFRARHENELYREVRQIDWPQFLGPDDTLAVDAITQSQRLNHSKYLALKTKDAIVDQFRNRTGRRPSVDINNPTVRINLHISNKEDATLSLDSSGDSLHKRGYRTESVAAPINETLAAGMILHSGWSGDSTFLDPMCGSGTIAIEAALIAWNIAPQHRRSAFGFSRWSNFDASLWKDVRTQARAAERPSAQEILAGDQDFRAIKACQLNILAAGLEGKIKVERQRFERMEAPNSPGILMMNPPYDERLEKVNINDFYRQIGDKLKNDFSGWEAWIISSNKEALKCIGLRPSRKLTLYNGPLECKFQKYELYEGSRKGENPSG